MHRGGMLRTHGMPSCLAIRGASLLTFYPLHLSPADICSIAPGAPSPFLRLAFLSSSLYIRSSWA